MQKIQTDTVAFKALALNVKSKFYLDQLSIRNYYFKKRLIMKVANSLKTLKSRERNCQLVRRRGRVYVINKKNPRFKARQG